MTERCRAIWRLITTMVFLGSVMFALLVWWTYEPPKPKPHMVNVVWVGEGKVAFFDPNAAYPEWRYLTDTEFAQMCFENGSTVSYGYGPYPATPAK